MQSRGENMKELKIDPAIRRDEKLLRDVEQVTEYLNQEIGPKASKITAEWSFDHPNIPGERYLKLEISDESDRASFATSEGGLSILADSGISLPLIRLWGDLLQARSHRQVDKLKLIVQGLE
jgi:hypothetical protein